MSKSSSTVMGVLLHLLEGVAVLGLSSSAAIAVALGKFMLGGALAVVALGVYVRFKRGRVRPPALRGLRM